MYGWTKRARVEKEEETENGEDSRKSQEPEEGDEGAVVDHSQSKGFSSLPRNLQEVVLLKTSTDSRLKLFQVNQQLREWVFQEGLFPKDVGEIKLTYRKVGHVRRSIFRIAPRGSVTGMDEDNVEIEVVNA